MIWRVAQEDAQIAIYQEALGQPGFNKLQS
jgi:hypothetical protein